MADIPAWTLEAAMEHFQMLIESYEATNRVRFEALEKATHAALRSAEQAVLKAETAAERRFESVNEFRNTLSDQQRNLMPRSEVGVVAGALTDRIIAIESGMSAKLSSLEKQVDAIHAERLGIKGGWGYAVGAIGFLLAIGSLIMIGIKFVQATP